VDKISWPLRNLSTIHLEAKQPILYTKYLDP
jgi:hypothetical protein